MVLEETDRQGWILLSYSLVVGALVLFAVYAIVYTKYFSGKALDSTAGFITARGSQGKWRLAWSFYAGAVGAWCIVTPSAHVSFSGWIGLLSYAVAIAIPPIFVSFLGTTVKKKWPEVNSVGDVVMERFGPTARFVTIVVTLLSMSVFMVVEFTTIGALFQDFVGDKNYPIIIVVCVVTTAYTAYGGLLVSIVTDQVQAIFSLVLLAVLSIIVAATFRQPLPANFGEYSDRLGANVAGYSSIFTLPTCLISSVMFNEALWQRVWAAKDERALKSGAFIAGGLIVVAVFTYGLFGFLAIWGGLVDFDTVNPNLIMFQVFRSGQAQGQATVSKWVHVLVLVLGATMNQSAIDSVMNGITATLSSHFLRREPIAYSRFCVVLISIPVGLVALSSEKQIIQLFVTANMLGICCLSPLIIGIYWDSPLGRRVVSESTYVFSCVATILITLAYGTVDFWDGNFGCSLSAGAAYGWINQPYDWDYFLVAVLSSLGTTFLFGATAELLHRRGVEGITVTELLAHVPGFHALVQDSAEQGVGPIHSACMACFGREVDAASAPPGGFGPLQVEHHDDSDVASDPGSSGPRPPLSTRCAAADDLEGARLELRSAGKASPEASFLERAAPGSSDMQSGRGSPEEAAAVSESRAGHVGVSVSRASSAAPIVCDTRIFFPVQVPGPTLHSDAADADDEDNLLNTAAATLRSQDAELARGPNQV